MKVVVDVKAPIGLRISWRGRTLKIPTKVVVEDKDLDILKRYLDSFNITYSVLVTEQKEVKVEDNKEEVVDNTTLEEETSEVVEEASVENEEPKFDEKELKQKSKKELKEIAKELGIENYDKLTKSKLIQAILDKQ